MLFALIGYGLAVRRRRSETWHDFGLRTDNLRESICPISIWTALATTLIILWAWATGSALWQAELVILLPLYPAYGVA